MPNDQERKRKIESYRRRSIGLRTFKVTLHEEGIINTLLDRHLIAEDASRDPDAVGAAIANLVTNEFVTRPKVRTRISGKVKT